MKFSKYTLASLALLTATLTACSSSPEGGEKNPESSPAAAPSPSSDAPVAEQPTMTIFEEELTREQRALYGDARTYRPMLSKDVLGEGKDSAGGSGSIDAEAGLVSATSFTYTVMGGNLSFELFTPGGASIGFENGVYTLLVEDETKTTTNPAFLKDMEQILQGFGEFEEVNGVVPGLTATATGVTLTKDFMEESPEDVAIEFTSPWTFRGYTATGPVWDFSFADPETGEAVTVSSTEGVRVYEPYRIAK